MPPLPPVLGPDDLPLAELMAASLDGEVYPFGSGHCLVDEVPTPELRLSAALAGRATRYIAELGTAAWVWGAAPVTPHPVELCVDLRARARPARLRHASVREVGLQPGETCTLGLYRVTTPLRTAVDLARIRPAFTADDERVTQELAAIGGFTLADCLTAMDARRNLPAKRLAAMRLRAVLS